MTESVLRVTFECHTECIYTRRQAMDEEAHKQTHTHTHTHTHTQKARRILIVFPSPVSLFTSGVTCLVTTSSDMTCKRYCLFICSVFVASSLVYNILHYINLHSLTYLLLCGRCPLDSTTADFTFLFNRFMFPRSFRVRAGHPKPKVSKKRTFRDCSARFFRVWMPFLSYVTSFITSLLIMLL